MANDSSQNQYVQNPQHTLKIPPHLLPSEISVFGYGVTSKPFVEFINSCGKVCNIYDDRFEIESSDKNGNILLPPSAFCANKSSLEFISPGILPHHKYFSKSRNKIGEYDYIWELMAFNNFGLKSIWISGTNGKTTTTQMLAFLLESFGGVSGGNIGTPLTNLALEYAKQANKYNKQQASTNKVRFEIPIWVLESSSFAMHYANIATPQIYLLLPLSQDHISWHNGYENYVADKLRVLSRMSNSCFVILPKELQTHKIVEEYLQRHGGKNTKNCGNTITNGAFFYKDSSDLAAFLGIELESICFNEPFLLDSLLALSGAFVAKKMGLLDSCAKSSLSEDFSLDFAISVLNSFHIGAHRIEEFYEPCKQDDLESKWLWVDDSKGTNTDATLQAFKRYKGRCIYAVLGGDDKGADIEPIFTLLSNGFCTKNSFVKIFAIGSNEAKILSLAKEYGIFAKPCGNLKNAIKSIKKERDIARKKNEKKAKEFIVSFVGLLSPAAASLDQFSSYKERGELFKKYALES